jgi:hypothetical protein
MGPLRIRRFSSLHRIGNLLSGMIIKGTKHDIFVLDDSFSDVLNEGLIREPHSVLDEKAIGIGHGSSVNVPMVSEKSHLPRDGEIAKGRRTHQNQKEHGNDEFKG